MTNDAPSGLVANPYSAEEVIEIACQIERNGAAYYRRAADLVAEPAVAELFSALAEMEDAHEIVFENLRGDPDLLSSWLGDPGSELVMYLQAVADGHVFPVAEAPGPVVVEGSTPEEILRRAIGFEKDSIVFYQGMLQLVPEGLGREKVQGIIAEELRHVGMIGSEISRLRVGAEES